MVGAGCDDDVSVEDFVESSGDALEECGCDCGCILVGEGIGDKSGVDFAGGWVFRHDDGGWFLRMVGQGEVLLLLCG